MSEPLKLHVHEPVAESMAEKSARLHDAARQAAQDALREVLATTMALQADWAALSLLVSLPPGIREEARQMADVLQTRADTVRAILGRVKR